MVGGAATQDCFGGEEPHSEVLQVLPPNPACLSVARGIVTLSGVSEAWPRLVKCVGRGPPGLAPWAPLPPHSHRGLQKDPVGPGQGLAQKTSLTWAPPRGAGLQLIESWFSQVLVGDLRA